MNKKNLYTAPEVEVVEVRGEGVVCTSQGSSSKNISNLGYDTVDDWD